MSDASVRITEIAERWQCSERNIRNLVRDGKLRAFRLGKLIRVPIDAVEEFEQNRHDDVEPPPVVKIGYVYFIGAGNIVKIGFAQNVEKRLATLRTGNHEKLVLLHMEIGTSKDERRFHARFSHLRHYREWFTLSGELAEFLKSGRKFENTLSENA